MYIFRLKYSFQLGVYTPPMVSPPYRGGGV
jgi:hypothetical protein